MVDHTGTENQATARLDRKYRRILETGISFLITLPIALQLLIWFHLYNEGSVLLTILVMSGTGAYCIWYGDQKRQNLKRDSAGSSSSKFPK